MSNSTMTCTTSGQNCLFFPILTVRTRSIANKGMYFVQFAMNLLVSAVVPAF